MSKANPLFTLLLGVLQTATSFVATDPLKMFVTGSPWPKRAAAMLFVFSVVVPLWAYRNSRKAHHEKVRNDAQSTLLAVLAKIIETTRVPVSEIGLHAYTVKKRWTWRGLKAHQVRIAQVRLRPALASSIVWTKGKGVVGECWRLQNQYLRKPLFETHAKYLKCDEATWDAAPDEMRMGLTFEEWTATSHYAAIFAWPIQKQKDGGRVEYAGCIALDCTNERQFAKLASPGVRELLGDAAEAVRRAMALRSST